MYANRYVSAEEWERSGIRRDARDDGIYICLLEVFHVLPWMNLNSYSYMSITKKYFFTTADIHSEQFDTVWVGLHLSDDFFIGISISAVLSIFGALAHSRSMSPSRTSVEPHKDLNEPSFSISFIFYWTGIWGVCLTVPALISLSSVKKKNWSCIREFWIFLCFICFIER